LPLDNVELLDHKLGITANSQTTTLSNVLQDRNERLVLGLVVREPIEPFGVITVRTQFHLGES
jgi:hypothetical protein